MNFSPDKKYILYAKDHNLYVKGNKALGVDTTEVQLTTDGVPDFRMLVRRMRGRMVKFLLMLVGVLIAGMHILCLMIIGNCVTFG